MRRPARDEIAPASLGLHRQRLTAGERKAALPIRPSEMTFPIRSIFTAASTKPPITGGVDARPEDTPMNLNSLWRTDDR